MKNKTLVILAAGMGSRFGGMKQIEPVGPNGEFIIDYSVYSAIKYGFTRVVFVIKEENLKVFKNTIGSRVEDHIEVCYAFQKLEDIPAGFEVPEGRVKPWGTAHALYAARDYIDSKFAVINADDFYGDEAFKELSEYLDTHDNDVIVGYEISKTLSANGSVKRGVIFHDNSIVKKIIESSCIKDTEETVKCTPLDTNIQEFIVPNNQPVSMLINGFTKDFVDYVGSVMESDFDLHKDDLLNYEMLLPDIMSREINEGKKIEVISTKSTWMGMTYKTDCDTLKEYINNQIKEGIYPNKLW
ncbi:MAG: NDP-sugar synthase [Bacilli bacterium]